MNAKQKKDFLAQFRLSRVITKAAVAVGVTRGQVNYAREVDSDFAAAVVRIRQTVKNLREDTKAAAEVFFNERVEANEWPAVAMEMRHQFNLAELQARKELVDSELALAKEYDNLAAKRAANLEDSDE